MPKKQLLWEAHLRYYSKIEPVSYKHTLFEYNGTHTFEIPETTHEADEIECAYDEIELLDFTLTSSPFRLVNEPFEESITTRELVLQKVGADVKIYGYRITVKQIRAKNDKIMAFGYFYDQEGNYFDTTHFPQALEKFPYRGSGVYEINGKVAEEFGF